MPVEFNRSTGTSNGKYTLAHDSIFNNNTRDGKLLKTRRRNTMDNYEIEKLKDLLERFPKLQPMCKLATYNNEKYVLSDKCQYWDGGRPTGYSITIEVSGNKYTMRLWTDEPQLNIIKVAEVRLCDAYEVINDLWMTSQHLCISKHDGKNCVWTKEDAYSWWEDKIYRYNGAVLATRGEKL